MNKSLLLILLFISIVAIAENTQSPVDHDKKNKGPQKFCLFHDKVYEVIPFSDEECSYIVPGRNKNNIHGIGVPHDSACYGEYIRMRR